MPSNVGASAHLRHATPWVLALALAACAAPATGPVADPRAVADAGPVAGKVQVSAAWPAHLWPAGGYALQGAGFAEASLAQLRLEVFHADAAGVAVSDGVATVAAAGGLPAGRVNLAVVPGPNRWAYLSGLDAAGQPLASLASAISLVDGGSFELDFDGVSHATGRAIAAWKPSGASASDPDQVARVKAYIQRATGFNAATNTHSGPNPYAFRARALGDAAATASGFLDGAALPEHLVEGWSRLTVVATANGQALDPGSYAFTLYDPTSTGERLAPAGSTWPRVAPGNWAYRLDSTTGTVWGMVALGEGEDRKLSVAVDAPVVGLGPQAGPWVSAFGRTALGSTWWSSRQADPVAQGLVVGEAESGASEAFAVMLANDPLGGVVAQGEPVAVAAVAQRSAVAVWGAAVGTDVALLATNAQGKLMAFKSSPANLAAGTAAFLGDLPATDRVAPGPGQVALASGATRLYHLHRSGLDVVLSRWGGTPVALRLPHPPTNLALAVVGDRPWVAVEMEATAGQRVIVDGLADEATGELAASAWHLGGLGEQLGQPALAEAGASVVALAYEKQVGTTSQVAYVFRDDVGSATAELALPASTGFDQKLPSLTSAGADTPPWVALVEQQVGPPGSPARLRLGQLGGALLSAETGVGRPPLAMGLLPVDAPMAPETAHQWAFTFHLLGQGPALRSVVRGLPQGTPLPALAF